MNDRDDDLERKLAALPRELEPPRDLWAGVGARIEAKKRRARVARHAVTGGAALLLAAAVALVLRSPSPHAPIATLPTPSAATPPVSPSGATAPEAPSVPLVNGPFLPLLPEEATYEAAIAALAPVFDARRGELPAKDVEAVTGSLAAVDQAIRATSASLAEAPADDDLRQELDAEYEQKIQILNDVLDWTTRS